MVQQLLTLQTIMNLLILLIYCQKARESASFHLLIFGKPKPRFVLSSRY
jgi:hypothetical protein